MTAGLRESGLSLEVLRREKERGNGLARAIPASPPCDVPYRLTSFRSFAGSPDGLFASAVQLPPAVNTRESLAMLHWSTVASASMLPCAVATKLGVGGGATPAAGLAPRAGDGFGEGRPDFDTATRVPGYVGGRAVTQVV